MGLVVRSVRRGRTRWPDGGATSHIIMVMSWSAVAAVVIQRSPLTARCVHHQRPSRHGRNAKIQFYRTILSRRIWRGLLVPSPPTGPGSFSLPTSEWRWRRSSAPLHSSLPCSATFTHRLLSFYSSSLRLGAPPPVRRLGSAAAAAAACTPFAREISTALLS